jgi:hypothetical protein
MRYLFKLQGDHFTHVETGECAGWVVPLKSGKGFSVHRALTNINERDKIAVVKSIDDALPTLTTYYVEHPPQWKRTRDTRFNSSDGYTMFTAFVRWTFYGVFTVKQDETGVWVATRCTDALLLDGEQAIFSTAEIARHVVDLHERDGISNYPALDDGFSWDIH